MKIEIDCITLKNELSKLKEVFTARSPMALVSNVLFDASGNEVSIKSTDLELTIVVVCPCEVIQEGRCAPNAVTLLRTISALVNDKVEKVTIELEANNWVRVSAENVSEGRIAGVHPDDFPQLRDVSKATFYDLNPALLLDLIKRTSFAICLDGTRPSLMGAFLRFTPVKTLIMIATDGHRLAKSETKYGDFSPPEIIPKLHDGLILPHKAIKLLTAVLSPEDYPLQFAILSQGLFCFRHGPITLQFRLIDACFPSYDDVLSPHSESGMSVVVRREELLHAIKFVQLFADPKTSAIRITYKPGKLNVYAQTPQAGEGSRDIDVIEEVFDSSEFSLSYNYKYLLDVLNNMDEEEIVIAPFDSLHATSFRFRESTTTLYVVMPMRM